MRPDTRRAWFLRRHPGWSWRAPEAYADLFDWHIHVGRWTLYIAREAKAGHILDVADRYINFAAREAAWIEKERRWAEEKAALLDQHERAKRQLQDAKDALGSLLDRLPPNAAGGSP